MPVVITPCTDDDVDRAFHILSSSFAHTEPFVDALYPEHDTPSGHTAGTERLLQQRRNDPDRVRFMKAMESDSAKMIGFASWIIEPTMAEKLDGDYWSSTEEKEFAQVLFEQQMLWRNQEIKQRDRKVVLLDCLCVDPTHQKNGAGSLLVKWGTDLADSLEYPIILEAAEPAWKLYEKHGFETVARMTYSLPSRWADKELPSERFMLRQERKV